MQDFDAFLTRSFAEAPEPVDDGFNARVAAAVAKREKFALWLLIAQGVGVAIAAVAVAGGGFAALAAAGPSVSASFWLEVARLHGAVTQTSMNVSTLAAGLTPMLLAAVALAGGAWAYLSAQN